MKNPVLIVVSLTVINLVILAASPSHASIIWTDFNQDGVKDTTGQIDQLTTLFYPAFLSNPPSPPISRSLNLRAFDECQNVRLPRNIKISKANPSYIESPSFANYDRNLNILNNSLAYD